MKEVDLRQKDLPREGYTSWSERQKPDMSREPIIDDIIKKVEAKEKVFVKFLNDHDKRPGAIALVKKVTGDPVGAKYNRGEPSNYTFHLKWDDRKNTTKVRLNYYRHFAYLPDYKGPTVWYMFDPKAYGEEHAEPVLDRLGNELNVNDAVIYINARYSDGSNMDFGVVREIKRKGAKDWHGNLYVDVTTIIESVAISEDEEPLMSKIGRPERSVMKMTDVDLPNEALIRKWAQ